jgi:hypothetical protein
MPSPHLLQTPNSWNAPSPYESRFLTTGPDLSPASIANNDAPRAGSRLVQIVNGAVAFRDQPHYLIPLSRLKTPLQLLGCLSHLMTKPWITPEAARAFIDVVCRHHGIRLVETA